MAWTAPMTAVANTAFTAAQFNTHVRDNLLETAPAKAGASVTNSSIFVKTGTNAITARLPDQNFVLTAQSTSSTSYTNLSTVGPSVTATTGARALVIISGELDNNSNNSSFMSVDVSGATTFAATDIRALRHRDGTGTSGAHQASYSYIFTTLTPGSHTFTAKYRVIGGTGTFSNRYLSVIPF